MPPFRPPLSVPRAGAWRADLLLRPLPPPLLVPAAAIVLVAGAAYCLGYEGLSGGIGLWPLSLLWSAYGVWPWFFLFEYVKRREESADAPLPLATIALLLVATGAFSVAMEFLVDALRGGHAASIGLQLLRRLPAIGATLLLLLLARRERRSGEARGGQALAEDEAETLRRHAADILWIRAADNYLELHFQGKVWTRRITMRDAAALLEPLGFVRIHRSFIVNRAHVEAVAPGKSGPEVRVADGTKLPTGRAFSANVRILA
jgi:hypothetical protein